MSDDQTKPALPTLAEIEAMEALLGRASPGPLSDGGDDYVFCSPSLGGVPIFEVRGTGARLPQAANRRWLVALWNWAPLLLAAAREVLRLREVVAVVNGDGGHGSPQDAIDRHYAICAERDALREELARVRGRLEKAQTFEWIGRDGVEWNIHTFKNSPSADDKTWNVCKGIKLHKHAVTLDAAWAAAEQAAGETGNGGTPP